VAALARRRIPYSRMPRSLLAEAYSSLGGNARISLPSSRPESAICNEGRQHGRAWIKAQPVSSIHAARRTEKLATLALLFILLTAATAGVTSVLISPAWALLWESLLFGLLVGWVLAIFRRSVWLAALIVIGLGLVFTLLFASGLDAKVAAMLAELARVAGRVFTIIRVQVSIYPNWAIGCRRYLPQLGWSLSGFLTGLPPC